MRITRGLNISALALALAAGAAGAADPFASQPGEPVLQLAQSGAAASVNRPAGRVVLTTSNLRAEREDGSVRALSRRSAVYEGDTLITGDGGIAQVRMRDGALLSLRRGTEFRIEEFRFEESAAEQDTGRGFFALLRGGFRTITGFLGKRNRQNYRVNTPVATIGIRGTHYGLRLCSAGDCAAEGIEEDGLYGGVVDGSISANNQAGPTRFGNDEYFHVAAIDARADSLLTPPGVVFGPDLPPPAASGADAQARLQRNLNRLRAALSSQAPEAAQIDFLNRRILLERAVLNNRTSDDPRVRVIIDQLRDFIADLGASGGQAAPETALALALLFESPTDASTLPLVLGVRTDSTPAVTESLTVIDETGSPIYAQQVRSGNCADLICGVAAVAATPNATGANGALGVRWGRWDDAWALNIGGLGQAEAGSAHFMLGSNITTPAELGLRQNDSQAFYTVALGGSAPTNQAGVAGVLNGLNVEVNFATQQVVDYDLALTPGGGGNVSATILGGPVGLADAAAGGIGLVGMCNGGGECSGAGAMVGAASTVFVGDGAQALMSAYSLAGSRGDDETFGFAGTALVGEQPSVTQE